MLKVWNKTPFNFRMALHAKCYNENLISIRISNFYFLLHIKPISIYIRFPMYHSVGKTIAHNVKCEVQIANTFCNKYLTKWKKQVL